MSPARHPSAAPTHVLGPKITYHRPAAPARSRLTARQQAEVRANRLSLAWSHVFHPKGATRGVVALRAEPLRNPPRQSGSRRPTPVTQVPAAQAPAAQPLQCTVPSAPAGVGATVGANQATVSWSAANGNGTTVTGYVLREASGPDKGASIATGGTALTATLTGLAGGSAATFTVVAESSCGAGAAGTSSPVTPTGSAATYVGAVLRNSPAVFYRLDEPAGATVMADSSGHAADGGYSGQQTLGALAPLASDQATSTGYTTCCGGLGTGQPALPRYASARTVQAWINTTDATTNQAVAGWGDTTTDESFIVSVSAQSINVDGWNDYLSFPVARPLDTGQWHLLTVTFDGANVTAYLDGQLEGTAPFAGIPNTQDPSGIELAGFPGYNFFQGDMADVAVYPSALSAATVASAFAASGYTVPTAPVDVNAFYGGPNGVNVTWGHASAGGTAVTGYLVTAVQGSIQEDAIAETGDATAARVTGLAPGSYTFQVVALDAFGAGPAVKSPAFTVAGALSTYASTTLADSPAVFYKLGDSDAAAMADSSGHAATGYYTSDATLGLTGPLASDPTTAISDANDGPAAGGQPSLPLYSSARTIEGWINTTYTGEQYLASYGVESTSEGFTVVTQPNDVIVSGWGDDLTFTSPAALDNGIWHFVTATTNGTSATVYVDGTAIGTQNFPSELDTLPAPQGFVIGAGEQDCCGYFDGDLADVAVFGSVLSSAQITAQFAASGLGRPPAPAAPSATAAVNQATVSWQAPETAGPAVTSYLITAMKGGTAAVNAISAPATATSAIVTGLAGGTAYTFTIQAVNDYGPGTVATTASVTPTGSPSSYASTVLSASPSVFYRLADGYVGAMADSSGHGAAGSYSAPAVTLGQAGPLGNDIAPAAG
ncbi:MAG: LamG-like jellyroll fold domain-containing protein, partial [Streptosporangiaceae bacterium]